VPPVWRTLPAVLAALLLVPSAQAAAAAPGGWRDGVAAAREYAEGRTCAVAFAVRTQRGLAGKSADRAFDSASVTKAMLLAAYLRRPSVRGRALRPSDRNLLTPMIRWSSNKDASRVNHLLGPGALDRLARRVGMRAFTTLPECWSCSRITAGDQTRLFLRIDRLLPRRHRAYGMGLLERVVPRQRWGVALAAPAGWRLYFKGGWTTTVDHQVALLARGRRRLAVAVLTSGSPSHAYAIQTLRGVFDRLLRPLRRG
jgi:Beta-lactamase enzyme family